MPELFKNFFCFAFILYGLIAIIAVSATVELAIRRQYDKAAKILVLLIAQVPGAGIIYLMIGGDNFPEITPEVENLSGSIAISIIVTYLVTSFILRKLRQRRST